MIGTKQNSSVKFTALLKQDKNYIWLALLIAVVYFIIMRFLFPVPSFFSDSYTFVGAANTNQPVTFRPIMYSKLIRFFKLFSTSDVLLIAAQYFSIVLANLFLFFTCSWLFGLSKWYKWTLFVLLIGHPFYVFAGNYVSSDAFFTSFTVGWFTLLLWIMHKSKWYIILLHVGLLGMLFMLRYNAIYFPVFTAFATLFTRLKLVKKLAVIATSFLLVAVCIEFTSYQTKAYARSKVFSPFSGWQLANNALHVVRYENIDASTIGDPQVKAILLFNQHYFDTTKGYLPPKGTAWFMWEPNGPLKKYMKIYDPKGGYFKTWTELGPLYGKFGRTIILQQPVAYIENFVLPNVKEYIYPGLEIYEKYGNGVDTVALVAQKYFKYKTNKIPQNRPVLYTSVFGPLPLLFTCSNVLLILFGSWYFFSRRYRKYSILINGFLLLFACFFIANFFFITLLAPSVFRYHLPVLILSFPITLFLISAAKRRVVAKSDIS